MSNGRSCGLGCPSDISWFLLNLLDDLDNMESNLFCNSKKVYLKLLKGLEHPPVLLVAYCDYLIQAESLTVAV